MSGAPPRARQNLIFAAFHGHLPLDDAVVLIVFVIEKRGFVASPFPISLWCHVLLDGLGVGFLVQVGILFDRDRRCYIEK